MSLNRICYNLLPSPPLSPPLNTKKQKAIQKITKTERKTFRIAFFWGGDFFLEVFFSGDFFWENQFLGVKFPGRYFLGEGFLGIFLDTIIFRLFFVNIFFKSFLLFSLKLVFSTKTFFNQDYFNFYINLIIKRCRFLRRVVTS